MAVCLLEIPIALTSNGCTISSLISAIYQAYFGWTIIDFFDTFSIYAMLFLSYDRFLAVWFPHYFKFKDKVKEFKWRAILTVIFNVIFLLFFFINVQCSKDLTIIQCHYSNSSVILDAHRANADQTWHKAYLVCHEVLDRWIPKILMGGFNVSLIVAITRGRLRNPASSNSGSRPNEFQLTITLICLICTFFLCTIPISVWIIVFNKPSKHKCYCKHELLRAIGNILHLFEKSLTIIFLTLLNSGFKQELKKLLHVDRLKRNTNSKQQTLSVHSGDKFWRRTTI